MQYALSTERFQVMQCLTVEYLEYTIKYLRFIQKHLKIKIIISKLPLAQPKQHTPQMMYANFIDQDNGLDHQELIGYSSLYF